MAVDPARMGTAELSRAFRRRALSPVEVTRACLARIAADNGSLGAYCLIDEVGALAAARAAEARWLAGAPASAIDGVPTSIKDIVLMRGHPTRRGSRTTEGVAIDRDDAPVTARLRAAGAVILGKTTTPEFGWKAVTDNPMGEVARNPWDTSRGAGGSSGGAAIAAATGMGVLHLGTDGGGSIRVPASFCGVVGLKPTFGRVPAWPMSPFGTVAHLGPIARTIADLAAMLTVLAQPDARDWHALPAEPRDWSVGLDAGVRGLRIAASRTLGGTVEVEPSIAAAFETALETLADLGAEIVPVEPALGDLRILFARHWFPGAARLLSELPQDALPLLDPGLRDMAAEGAAMSAAEVLEAQRQRGELGIALQRLLHDHDLLATPTVAVPPLPAGAELSDPATQRRWIDWAGFSYPFNLSQQPAITVPCGRDALGLPAGLQLVAAKYREDLCLRAARAFEAVVPPRWPDVPDQVI